MKSATERRQLVLEAISDRRKVKMADLATEFGVNERTIRRDVQYLSCSYPVVTENWRGGGIRAMDGWYISRRYLHDGQVEFLRSFLPGLQPEERKKMEDILLAFAKPRKGDKNGITQNIREGAASV